MNASALQTFHHRLCGAPSVLILPLMKPHKVWGERFRDQKCLLAGVPGFYWRMMTQPGSLKDYKLTLHNALTFRFGLAKHRLRIPSPVVRAYQSAIRLGQHQVGWRALYINRTVQWVWFIGTDRAGGGAIRIRRWTKHWKEKKRIWVKFCHALPLKLFKI